MVLSQVNSPEANSSFGVDIPKSGHRNPWILLGENEATLLESEGAQFSDDGMKNMRGMVKVG